MADAEAASRQLDSSGETGSWAIAADFLWDGTGDQVQQGLCVVVKGRQILRVCPVEEAEESSLPLERYPGCCLLPGLIDAHVHMEFSEDFPLHEQPARTSEQLQAEMRERALRMVCHGITAARDLGGTPSFAAFQLRDDILTGHAIGPRLVCAGQPLTSPNGHCHQWGGVVAGALEIRAMVDKQVQRGADWIKVMATGGMRTPGTRPDQAQFDVDDLKEVVAAAAAHGVPVAAHAHATVGIVSAIAAGCRTVEHCSWIGPKGWCSGVDDEAIEEMASRGIYISPTANANWANRSRFSEKAANQMSAALMRARRRGVTLVASSDAGAIPGLSHTRLTGAIEVLADLACMSGVEALRAATSDCAAAIGLGEECGRLQSGFAADLLLVPGNPLLDLRVLRRPRAVIVRGHRVDPGEFLRPAASL